MRAVVLDENGRPHVRDIPEPKGKDTVVRVRATGLCGSDLEKLGRAPAGTVLGHEVAGELEDGKRVALVHHLPCGKCERCLGGHESTCDQFRRPTIRPGGFASLVRARAWVDLPDDVDHVRGSFAEPLACVLRGAEVVPRGRILVMGCGFIGRLFADVLRRRGDDVFAHDRDTARAVAAGPPPDDRVDAAVLCARGGGSTALAALEPGGTLLVFAAAAEIDPGVVYTKELTVTGSRSATPRHMLEALELLPHLPELPVSRLPLDRFEEGLDLYRSGAALKVVFEP
jgi:L-iditol 2-dehydrogenase